VFGPLWRRYVHVKTVLKRPFVLFLRRFSTFSDRAVVTLVLREAPADTPVVFLTPTRSQAKDWNPFVVGFSGLKVRHPLRSMPLVPQVADADWQAAAARLIDHATLIVIDISEASEAMKNEMEMIGARDRWRATVCLRLLDTAVSDDWAVPSATRIVDYRKSWRQALPRLLLGVLLGLGSVFILYTAFLISLGQLVLRTVGEIEPLFIAVVVISWLLALALTVSAYVAVFALPTVDRAARSAVREALRRARAGCSVESGMHAS
jgi:hypothetical protein